MGWHGRRLEEIAIADSVIDLDLGTPALQREIETVWQARSIGWERDGESHPGHYEWLVEVHDASGKILASSRELHLRDCCVVPTAVDRFDTARTLRALVRIYPAGKLAKRSPESRTATYLLKGRSGVVEMQQLSAREVDWWPR